MANTLLYPITVSAKVIRSATKVPTLGGAAFNRDGLLEPGIHLHWALPDSLTASRLLSDQGTKTAVFPAVPDLWLVMRFNPGASSATPLAKRTWSAWVVDSILGIVTPLPKWAPPTDRDASRVHTLAGVLPNANGVGYSGWGLWDTDPATGQAQNFDPAMAAYYPESRKRFGFYDALDGLASKGNVSYLVVGWYWTDKHDPLTVSAFPSHILDQWKAVATIPASANIDLSTQVAFAAPAQPAPVWNVDIKSAAVPVPAQAQLDRIKRLNLRAGSVDLQAKKLESMKTFFPAPAPSPALLETATYAVTAVARQTVYIARETICHGSIVSVPLAGSPTAPVPITNNNVQLYPNVKRALADLACKTGNADQVNAIEMLLADLGSQKFSTGGVVDMAGAAHAATFQSVPGQSKNYVRIDIEAPPSKLPRATSVALRESPETKARHATGHWPPHENTRSASTIKISRIAEFPGIPTTNPPAPPDATAIPNFVASMQAAFATAVAAAAAKGITLDPRMVRVQDSRNNARSLALGATTDDSGSDAAGWWIDIQDLAAIGQLFLNAAGGVVSLPFVDNTYAIPGPRWYRPWAPQLVLSDIGRSYKFGHDTRFRADNKVLTRVSGTTLTSMTLSKQVAVHGLDLLAKPENLNVPGIPGEVVSLVRETLLLDTESASVMAVLGSSNPTGAQQNLAPLQAAYTSAIQGVLLARDVRFKTDVLQAVAFTGNQPSPIGITPWQDPFDPLFLDSNYSNPFSSMDDWKLDNSDVELTLQTSASNVPPVRGVASFTERSMVTATNVNVLKSALVTRTVVDPRGVPIRLQNLDSSLNADTFTSMNVVSASLTRCDSQLAAEDFRLRAGALRVNSFELIDIFGLARPWNSGIAPAALDGDASFPFWIPLPPRYPYWSRFTFRLTAADDPTMEATPLADPVCGLLLPDFIEHALEVFDGDGNGLGQLTSDIPIHGDVTAATTLNVQYVPHPWLDPDPDRFHHITNPTLKAFVQAVEQQSTEVPVGFATWAETGLSAMLRTIDTIRGTFDPAARVAQRTVSLIGEPILVMGARLQFNGTSTDKTQDLAGDPPLIEAPPDIPALTVRIGDVTRPDDGVLGLFSPGATPADAHFAPVTRDAAEKAIVNALTTFVITGTQAAVHPFVKDQESEVNLPANIPVDVVILADIRNALYATCGALPRKKITIPKDFVDSAAKNLEPSFYAGPILTTTQFGVEKALLPPPDVAGYSAEFLYQPPGSAVFQSTLVPAAPPLSDLPKSRVLLTDGWLRMVGVKDPS